MSHLMCFVNCFCAPVLHSFVLMKLGERRYCYQCLHDVVRLIRSSKMTLNCAPNFVTKNRPRRRSCSASLTSFQLSFGCRQTNTTKLYAMLICAPALTAADRGKDTIWLVGTWFRCVDWTMWPVGCASALVPLACRSRASSCRERNNRQMSRSCAAQRMRARKSPNYYLPPRNHL